MTVNDGLPVDPAPAGPSPAAPRAVEREASLTPERVASFRRRVRDGSYLTPEVTDAVARETLRRGDV